MADTDEDEDHQYNGKSASHVPVAALFKFLFDDIADEQNLASAKKIGDDKGCQCRDKYHCNSADNAREAERYNDFEKCLYIIGARSFAAWITSLSIFTRTL